MQQSLPSAARAYDRAQRAEIAQAVAAVKRQWRRMGPDFDRSYARLEPTLLRIAYQAQTRLAAAAQGYVPDVLEDTGQLAVIDAAARTSVRPLIGVAGDGRRVDSLLYGSVIQAKTAIDTGASVSQALRVGGKFLTKASSTLLSDTSRQSEALAIGVRPVTGYVRMLVAPSCSRCVVLAGKWFRKNQGFQRHPRCDCRHVPSSEGVAGDMTMDSGAYFDSLTTGQQDKTFTKAGAEAIRNGADVNQVVNARRGMKLSQGGLVTTEGTTLRGRAFGALRGGGTAEELAGTARRITRTGPEMRVVTRTRATTARLMPEQIQLQAKDRDDYLRLLRANGYVL